MLIRTLFLFLNIKYIRTFWDMGTTTPGGNPEDPVPREAFFRWERVESNWLRFFKPWFDWDNIAQRRRLNCIAGISIDFIPLSTAVILNRRVLLSAANYLDPYKTRQRDLRIWALGRAGEHNTPYRYRVWHIRRILPKSLNPEHQHGPYGHHSPRHDLAVVKSLDQMYVYKTYPTSWHYAYRSFIPGKHWRIDYQRLLMAGSGFHNLQHIRENYKIYFQNLYRKDIVDCSKYLPKWWGKFICIVNTVPAIYVQNGGGLFNGHYVYAVGCFEIRYNQDRILVFTDIRYYIDQIYIAAYMWPGMYYEYAYTQWGVSTGLMWDAMTATPYNPHFYVQKDLYPLGK